MPENRSWLPLNALLHVWGIIKSGKHPETLFSGVVEGFLTCCGSKADGDAKERDKAARTGASSESPPTKKKPGNLPDRESFTPSLSYLSRSVWKNAPFQRVQAVLGTAAAPISFSVLQISAWKSEQQPLG
jgi:hypothetical protein